MSPLPQRHTALALVAHIGLLCGCTSKLPQQPQVTSTPISVADDIGFVLDVKGEWVIKGRGSAPLQAGDSLPPKAVLSQAGESTRDDMVLVSLNTGKVEIFNKDNPVLPVRGDSDRVSRVWSLASKRYHSDLISAQSRGGEDTSKLRDTPIGFQDGGLFLAAAFEDMPPGSYRLRLEPIQGLVEHEDATVIPSEAYEWSPKARLPLKVETSLRGAYELYASNEQGLAHEESAVIVICSPAECIEINKELTDAEVLVAAWSDGIPRSIRRRFVQSTLAGLAAEKLLSGSSK